jgi:hypothetical protein
MWESETAAVSGQEEKRASQQEKQNKQEEKKAEMVVAEWKHWSQNAQS